MMPLFLCALLALIGLMGCAAVRVARSMTGERGTEARRPRPPVRSRQRGPGHKCGRPSEGKTVGCRLNIFQELKPLANDLRPSGPQSDVRDVAGGAWRVVGEEQTTSRPAGRAQRPRPLSRGPPGSNEWRVRAASSE